MALAAPNLGIPVIELLRVSTEEQAQDTRAGLDRQRECNRRTILAKGLTCIHTVELHVSGTVAPSHPKMLEIFAMLSAGTAKGVVLSELDRIFRPDTPSGYAALQIFQDCGALLYAGDTIYDLTTSNGLLQSSIRSAIAGFELSLIKERMQGAKEAKRRAGKCPTNELTLPLGIGYDRATDTWNYTPEIGRVKLLFELFDQKGIRNYSELGRQVGLGSASVKCVLRNPIYTGWRIIDKKRGAKRTSVSGKLYRVKVARPAAEVIRIKVLDGIILEECFERVAREMCLAKYNHLARFRANDSVNIGTGIAFCGCCGAQLMCVSGRGDKRAGSKVGYYQCRANYYLYRKSLGGCCQRHLRSDELDQAIVALTSTILRSPENLARILEASARKSNELIAPFTKAVSPSVQFDELTKREKRLVDAYAAEVITLDELRVRRGAIARERSVLKRVSLVKPAPGKSEYLQMARVVVKAAHRFTSINDKHQQKEIIHELFSEIHVRQNQIISFRFRPSAFADVAGGNATGSSVVLLPEPFCVGPPPDVLPPDHRRCIKCSAVKPATDFYRKLNRCDPCRAVECRERDKRRRAARSI